MLKYFLIVLLMAVSPAAASGTWGVPGASEENEVPIAPSEMALFGDAERCDGVWNPDVEEAVFMNVSEPAYFRVYKDGSTFRLWNSAAGRALQDLCHGLLKEPIQ